MQVNQQLLDVVNQENRIGTLGTADKNGQANVAYFGSPSLNLDGTLVMGLGKNRSLSNLEENPLAVFFCVAESPVTFTTKGYRLYLKVREIQKEGPVLNTVKEAIANMAGPDAAEMIVAGVIFDVSEVRPLIDMG